MKKKAVSLFTVMVMVAVMVMSAACGKKDNVNQNNEPENTPNQASSVIDNTDKQGNENNQSNENQPGNDNKQGGVENSANSDIYDKDGNLNVEYTETYYYSHTYRGDVFEYDLDKYAKICPFVGRWYIPGDSVWETSGYYFFADGFVSRVYATGTVCPIAVICYANDEGELVAEDWGVRFSIVNNKLTCTGDDAQYPYSLIEYPNDDFPVDFCGYWTKDPAGAELTDEFLDITYFDPNYIWNREDDSISGKAVMWSPITMAVLGDDGNPVNFLTMDGVQTMSYDGTEFWYRLNDDGDSDDSEVYDSEVTYFEDFFDENAYYAVDGEFDLAEVKCIYDYVGTWLINNSTSEYRYDENFAMCGFDIYADGFWTAINQNGIQSCTVGQVAMIADADAISLIDADGKIVSTLNLCDDGTLLGADGDIYGHVHGTRDFTYPMKGTPTECLGKWANPDGEGRLGVFFIDRDGTVMFPDGDHDITLSWTIDAEHIMITVDGADVVLSLYEVGGGCLVDEDGVVYEVIG